MVRRARAYHPCATALLEEQEALQVLDRTYEMLKIGIERVPLYDDEAVAKHVHTVMDRVIRELS